MKLDKAPSRSLAIVAALVGAAAAAGAAALLVDITSKKSEAKHSFHRVVAIDDDTEDPAIWGKNFPLQYESYLRTVDQSRTRFGGSEAVPRTPTDADPRSIVAQSRLEEDPRLVAMWSGYAFAKDFREERGHAYMFIDQLYTERQQVVKQPGACLNCHASTYVAHKKAGNGDVKAGFEKLNAAPYFEAKEHVKHPVTCIDCHEPESMQLRITRPAFMEGMRVLKASEGVQGYDVNTMATRNEMRSFVCAQCHVEYHFDGPEKRLTFPWHKGLKADQILAHFEETGFADWTHAKSGAKVLKAQHPEFELWSQGIHARSGVSCSDCHMPYKRVGAMKITDHHVQSPLLNVRGSCGTCHSWSDAELKDRAEQIQARSFEMRNRALDAVVALIADIEAVKGDPAKAPQVATAQGLQRKAQFLADFIEAENSTGFHAPQEAARVLTMAIDYARQGQIALRDPSFTPQLAEPGSGHGHGGPVTGGAAKPPSAGRP